ncbi:MAG TPA: 50S ribosomal protein L3 [Candidatus Moranbacteria bacterium]|nr:50S ribosomal protein L3 [Candidatus Moranbacteria bacterium]
MRFLLGKKIGMTTLYDEKKGALNITLVECLPNKVSLIRKKERDGYDAVQVEVGKSKKKTLRREFRILEDEKDNYKENQEITLDIFAVNDKVNVAGITKAKGFQGVMKRHGFHGSPSSHGHRHDHRAPGSIGSAYPQRVIKGKKMAGRMGGNRATVKNLEVVLVDKENNLLGIKGAIPGVSGRIIEIFAK